MASSHNVLENGIDFWMNDDVAYETVQMAIANDHDLIGACVKMNCMIYSLSHSECPEIPFDMQMMPITEIKSLIIIITG